MHDSYGHLLQHMLLVNIIYFTYNATLVKSEYTYLQVLSLANKLHVTTRLKRDITWGKSSLIFEFVC